MKIDQAQKQHQIYHVNNCEQSFRMRQHTVSSQTEKKINSILPNNYQSLKDIKDRDPNTTLNAQVLSPCRKYKDKVVVTTPQMLREELLLGLEQASGRAAATLLGLFKDWLDQRWKEIRIHLLSRLSKLRYLQPTSVAQSFPAIEKQILTEWKKNALLKGFHLLSCYTFSLYNFKGFDQLAQFYQILRNLTTKVTYLLFRPLLLHLVKKNYPLEDKLFNYTAITIITSHPQWKKVVQDVIRPLLRRSCHTISKKFNLQQQLDVRPQIVNIYSETPIYQKTAASIKHLQQCYSPIQIIQGLKNYRKSLVQQMQTSILQASIKKHLILEKEDYLSCIIYAIVTYHIQDIGATLKYFSFIFGEQLETILGSLQVDVYRVDLSVSYSFISNIQLRVSLEDLTDLDDAETYVKS